MSVEKKNYGTKLKWYIYPDYWKKSWGEPPFLGTVYADDEFEAIRRAYERGFVRVNFTFQPKPVLATESNKPRYRRY